MEMNWIFKESGLRHMECRKNRISALLWTHLHQLVFCLLTSGLAEAVYNKLLVHHVEKHSKTVGIPRSRECNFFEMLTFWMFVFSVKCWQFHFDTRHCSRQTRNIALPRKVGNMARRIHGERLWYHKPSAATRGVFYSSQSFIPDLCQLIAIWNICRAFIWRTTTQNLYMYYTFLDVL